MIAATRGVFFLACMTTSALAEPIAFSSGGSMGAYYEAFLVSADTVGVHENRVADVVIVRNDGRTQRGEWIVNCNENYAQVVDPNDYRVTFNPHDSQPSALRLPFDLWQAVCAGVYAPFMEAAGVAVAPGETVTALRRSFRISEPFPEFPMTNLVRTDEVSASGRSPLSAFVLCSPSVPTVAWTDEEEVHEMVLDGSNGRYESKRFQLSTAIVDSVCTLAPGVCPTCDTASRIPAD